MSGLLEQTKKADDFLATVIGYITKNQPVSIQPTEANLAILVELKRLTTNDVKRLSAYRKLKPPPPTMDESVARQRRYRKTGSTVGWEAEIATPEEMEEYNKQKKDSK